MCGIWAYIQLYKNDEKLNKMLNDFWKLKKRGPDNSILQTFGNVLVGFHRLSIMDLSFKSNQPYIFQDKVKTIVFICNGEIYNFKELIHNHNLDVDSNSDCMVIPKLYLKYDNDVLKFENLFIDEVKGEFSFLIFEFDNLKNLRKLFIGRDHIGIRPLYCSKDYNNDNLLFSSEIKSMNEYDEQVMEFPPGEIHHLVFDEFGNKSLHKKNFKTIYDIIPIEPRNDLENHLLVNLRNAVINSVRRRLTADRPIAFLLSGGVDSSLVCAIASKILKTPIKTFCCGMGEGTDLKYAKMVAEFLKTNHTEVYFTKEEGLNSISDVIYAIESWDTTTVRASVGQYLVSKYIGTMTDCKVVLVGEGPDEVCSSYMFNWNAPNGDELHETALEYVKNIHYFDCKRSDRCISYWGLEGRVPLLDPEVIKAYWLIPKEWRHPKYKGIEKWWLRQAFSDLNILPKEVLWRKKEAFSDGVSSKEESWYSVIQNELSKVLSKDEKIDFSETPTLEAYYYKKTFEKYFGKNRINIIPNYWQPKWCGNENEYIDPSARVLDVYKDEVNDLAKVVQKLDINKEINLDLSV
jgi:asparagine synthase (glutamine-hydrolysing)